MALFDWLAVLTLSVSMLMGWWRGLVFEVISLAGWVAAFFAAQWLAADVAAWLPVGAPDASWRYALAFVIVFVVVALMGGLTASLMRKLMSAAGMRPVDRTLGGLFGAARAGVALLAMAIVVHLAAFGNDSWWRESVSAPWLEAALQGMKPALPEKLASYLP